ncbi:hypothetical protein Cgig2_012945 [Carnegiea gigantea]|uniref:Uncharacterized protein n=1 Tax=Carnegiea gigantea TaxID=171969 RepID=A0A9Q1JJY4_9CARY|nr:hypothetical protein Cgig2_012945 [Carnegiea gigantea]
MKKNVVIPLYIIDLPEASSLQKVVESLNRLNKTKQRCQQQGPTQNQPQAQDQGPTQNQPQAQDQGLTQNQPEAQIQAQNDSEPSLSKVGAGADNLIVTPSTEKVNPSEKSSKCQPKVTANRPNKLPIRRSRPRAAKQPITPVQIDQAPRCTSTKSKSSYFLKSTSSSTLTRGRIEKHKRRKSRLPIPPQLSTIQLSGTKRKKPQQKTGNPVGRPRKIQRLSQASTSTAAASGVPTQSS